MNILEKIEKLELILPPAPKPLGVYKPTLIIDNFLYVSGQGPVKSDGSLIIGKVGKDMDKHEAKKAARQVLRSMIQYDQYENLDDRPRKMQEIKSGIDAKLEMEETRRRFVQTAKGLYHEQFNKGFISTAEAFSFESS